jgi:ProP effector
VNEPRSKRARIAAEAMFMRPARPAVSPPVLEAPHSRPTLTLRKPPAVPAPPQPKPKPKPRAGRAEILATIEWMRATWPAAFSRPVRPLALGVGAAILAAAPETIPHKRVDGALRHWVRSALYLQSVKAGVRRVNLDGSDAGEVTQEHRADATRRLVTMAAKAKRGPLQKQRG